jgi:hypothetical protein
MWWRRRLPPSEPRRRRLPPSERRRSRQPPSEPRRRRLPPSEWRVMAEEQRQFDAKLRASGNLKNGRLS